MNLGIVYVVKPDRMKDLLEAERIVKKLTPRQREGILKGSCHVRRNPHRDGNGVRWTEKV